MGILKKSGFTMIELLAVVAILAILITLSIFTFLAQLAKGRDARRKADLEKTRTVLEDYMNDNFCYPANLPFGGNFAPYLSQLPADPLNNTYYNYFYSYDGDALCKSWYKIYTKLENTSDPIIARVGCSAGCGPSANYNYWVSSPNMNQVTQILPAENWWPEITLPTSTPPLAPTSTPPIGATPTPTSVLAATPTLTPTSPPGATPTPTLVPTVTPTLPPPSDRWGCFSGRCQPLTEWCQPNYAYSDCLNLCLDPSTGLPKNECQ